MSDSTSQYWQIQAIRQELANLRGLVALIAENVGVGPHDGSIQDEWKEKGYFVVPQLLKKEDIVETKNEFHRLANLWPDNIPPDLRPLVVMDPSLFEEDEKHLIPILDKDFSLQTLSEEEKAILKTLRNKENKMRQFFRISYHSPYFQKLIQSSELTAIIHEIIGEKFNVLQTMAIIKPPGGGIKRWHQDNAYFGLEPHNIVGVWIAIDPVYLENGCMQVHPKSHLNGILPHSIPPEIPEYLGFTAYSHRPPPEDEVDVIELQSGDALFFHGDLSHFTGKNHTNKGRPALQFHFSGSECIKTEKARYYLYDSPEIQYD